MPQTPTGIDRAILDTLYQLNPEDLSGVDGVSLESLAGGLARIKDGGVSTAKLADNSVNKDKINADVAGSGLSQDVDGSLRVAAGGVTDAMLANSKWTFKAGTIANSAIAAQPKTIYAGADFLYICAAAGWGSGGENWMRVAVSAF
jgi:hypothetical protein